MLVLGREDGTIDKEHATNVIALRVAVARLGEAAERAFPRPASSQ